MLIVGLTAILAAGSAGAQSDEPVAPDTSEVTAVTTTVLSTSTTKPPAPCPKTAPLAVSFEGRVVAITDEVVELTVERVQAGVLTSGTVKVNYPLDVRFLHRDERYFVAASIDTESKLMYSKVRPLVGTPLHCVGVDPIYTTHADGRPVDTGVLNGMKGQWKRIPMFFIGPWFAALGILTALSIVRRSVWWAGRRSWRRLMHRAD